MIDVDKIQIGDKLKVLCPLLLDSEVCPIVEVVEYDEELDAFGYWIHHRKVVKKDILSYDQEKLTLVATNTKYSDISEGDIVEIACLSDEQIERWGIADLVGQQGEVIHKSKSIHVEVDGLEWCLQPENLRVVVKSSVDMPIETEDEPYVCEVAAGSVEEVNKALGIQKSEEQYTGGSSDYYKVFIKNPTTLSAPYEAECNDIIEALQMNFAEGNAFKAIWRKAKARQGVKKKGYDNGVYDSEKVIFFGERMLIEAKDKTDESI